MYPRDYFDIPYLSKDVLSKSFSRFFTDPFLWCFPFHPDEDFDAPGDTGIHQRLVEFDSWM